MFLAFALLTAALPAWAATPMVAAGFGHTVALKSDGTVVTWGYNGYGQLGSGTTAIRLSPVAVPGLTGVVAVAAGYGHTVALKSDGTVVAWGRNLYGALGDGTTTERWSPVAVPGLTGVVAVSAGWHHTVALKSDGTAMAWGHNANGQLGDGTTTNRLSPVAVPGFTGVIAVAAGAYHTVALKSDGTVVAWGNNANGQLGDGTTTLRLSPVAVPGLIGVVAVAGGDDHTLAVKSDGTVVAWGRNGQGQLGDGTQTDRWSPVAVPGLTGVVAMEGDAWHTVAVKSDGTVVAWGNNANGQLGDGTTTLRLSPVVVPGLTGVVAGAAGAYHTVAVKSDGTAVAWGLNNYGELGDGTQTQRLSPVAVPGLPGVAAATAVAAGTNHTVALKADGTLMAWGWNGYGQLGDGTTTDRWSSVAVPGLTGVAAVAGGSGGYHTVALKSDGTVLAWGDNNYGQLGDGTSGNVRLSPVAVPGLTGVVAVAASYIHTVALKADGTVVAWGNNSYGQLGDGTTINRSSPVVVPGLSGVVAVSAGAGATAFTVALKADGTVVAWGSNAFGQLGDGTTTTRLSPVAVPGLSGMVAVAAGANHVVALKSDGTVMVWGYNYYGQLGDGTIIDRLNPVTVPGLTGVVAVSAGWEHTLALKADGTVLEWGWNAYGQLGDGTTTDRNSPVAVPGLTGMVEVSGGAQHTVALKYDGTIMAWGFNVYGNVGDGTTTDRHSPVAVQGLGAPDTTPPTGSTSINSGAASITSTSATLTLSCTDSSGCSQMQFSNDNTTWSTAESYATSKAWTLSSGDGTKTVYVKFKDTAENWSTATISDTIVLDATAPSTTASPAGGTYTSAQSVTLTCSDGTGSGCDKIYYTTDGSTPTTSSSVYSTPISIAANTTLKFFAKDLAGNSETVKTAVYTINVTGGAVNLPKTGQTTSYATGDDGDLEKGVAWPIPRFTDNGNGSMTDNLTGLVWTQDANAPGPGACSPGATKTWQGALDYVACLNANSYLGHTDWRLPNVNELESLVNADQANKASWLNTQGFTNAQANYYWSSTTNANYTGYAWFVHMDAGVMNYLDKANYDFYVWPMRGGQSAPADLPKTGQTTIYSTGDDGSLQTGIAWPSPRFTNADGTTPVNGDVVKDQLTGLMWTKNGNAPGPACLPGVTKTWQGALDYVACLNTNNYLGYNDWRLPNLKDMRSLVNHGQARNDSWLNTQGYTNAQAYAYWSSTTYAAGYAWGVNMPYGSVYFFNKSDSYYVWPVRGGIISSVDTTPPTGTISINSGAASITSTSATLTLSCTDASGCSQMQFSNDNSTWSTAEAYSTSKAWTLSSVDGTKTVYVKFKDTAGNWSTATISDTIALDTTAPTTTASPAGGTYTSAQSVTLTCSDGTGSGCDKIYYTTDGTTPTTASSIYSTPISISSTTTLKFFAKDLAGNSEGVKTEVYTFGANVLIGGSIQGAPLNLTSSNAAVTTIAGLAGSSGTTDATGSTARFDTPAGITTDGTNLFVADYNNHTIRKIVISTGVVTTLAGSAGSPGSTDGTGSAARFSYPTGITTDGTNLFVADAGNQTIRKIVISTGVVTTIAGSSGSTGSTDGTGSAARFYYPYGITTDGTNLFVADGGNYTIRKIVISTGVVTTIAGTALSSGSTDATGTSARFDSPYGITTDGTNLFVSDYWNHTIRKIAISTGVVTTLAGSAGSSGSTDATGTSARFYYPRGITTDGTNLFVADRDNDTTRKVVISTGAVTTLAGNAGVSGSTDGTGSAARFNYPNGITTDGTNLFVADQYNNTIRKISALAADTTPPTGTISINSGAASITSTSATLTLSCTDASGCSQMQFSNDNTNWSTPETYGTPKTWNLSSGDGTKTVYVKFKDTAGNWTTATISDTITLDTPPSKPANIDVAQNGVKGELVVSWSNPSDADFNHIHIYRSTASGTLGTLIADNVTGIKYTDTGLASLTTYYYTVRAVDTAGNESTNTNATANEYGYYPKAKTLDATPPAVPTNIAAVDATTGGKINLSWTNPTDSDFSMIKVYRSTSSGTLGSAVFIGLATSYSDTGLTNGTTYYYTVRAVDTSSNETTNTTQVSATPTAPDTTPPSVPATGGTPVTDTQAGGTLTLSWTNPADSDFAFVRIYRSTTSGVIGTLVYDNVTGTSKTDTGLTNNAMYYYTIRSVDTSGNESTNTAQVSGMPTDIQAPAAVIGLAATLLSNGQIKLDWTRSASTDVNAYNIYYDNGTGTIDYTYANKIGTVQHPTTTWTSGNLTVGTAYKFAVRAEDMAQNEEASTSVMASAVPVTDPNAGDVRGYIKVPQAGQKINGNRVTVVADILTGASIDVKDMRLQYKPASSGSWTDITPADPAFPNPDTTNPWFTHWDVTGLATGDYLIRAISTNVNLAVDSNPAYITVTVSDISPEVTESVNQKTQDVSANTANTVSIGTDSGITQVTIPESAISSDTKVNVSAPDPSTKDSLVPSGYGKANEFREITLDSGQTSLSNSKEAEMIIPYDDANNDNIVDGTTTKVYDLKVMRYNTTTSAWEKLDSVVDTTNKVVKGKTNHFTLFGLLAPPNPTTPGWNIVAVPLQPNPNSASSVFGQTPYVYNPTTQGYDRPSTIQPGIGYWIKGGANLTASGTETSTAGNFSITIKKGWNMIGNPFRFNVNLSDCKVLYNTVEYTMAQAETNGYLIGTVYPYINGVYQFINASDGGELEPWVGYWILSDKDMTLLVPPTPAQ